MTSRSLMSRATYQQQLPFSDFFLTENLFDLLKKFKIQEIDDGANYTHLFNLLGPKWQDWATDLKQQIELTLGIARGPLTIPCTAKAATRGRLAGHAIAIAGRMDTPGVDPLSTTKTDFALKLRTAHSLLLTTLMDLQRNQDGFFQDLLGGPMVAQWSTPGQQIDVGNRKRSMESAAMERASKRPKLDAGNDFQKVGLGNKKRSRSSNDESLAINPNSEAEELEDGNWKHVAAEGGLAPIRTAREVLKKDSTLLSRLRSLVLGHLKVDDTRIADLENQVQKLKDIIGRRSEVVTTAFSESKQLNRATKKDHLNLDKRLLEKDLEIVELRKELDRRDEECLVLRIESEMAQEVHREERDRLERAEEALQKTLEDPYLHMRELQAVGEKVDRMEEMLTRLLAEFKNDVLAEMVATIKGALTESK